MELTIKILPEIMAISHDLEEIYKDLHANPELGFEEERTSKIIQKKLKEYGVDEIHTGLGTTGVVAVIHGNTGKKKVGLRADIDALPIQETTELPFASKIPNKMGKPCD